MSTRAQPTTVRVAAAATLAVSVTAAAAQDTTQQSAIPPPIPLAGENLGLTQEAWQEGRGAPGPVRARPARVRVQPGGPPTGSTPAVGTSTALVLDATETIQSIVVGNPDLVVHLTEPNSGPHPVPARDRAGRRHRRAREDAGAAVHVLGHHRGRAPSDDLRPSPYA